jgi:hypothetical protein
MEWTQVTLFQPTHSIVAHTVVIAPTLPTPRAMCIWSGGGHCARRQKGVRTMLRKIALSTALVVALASAASAEVPRKQHGNGNFAASHMMKQHDEGYGAYGAAPLYSRDSVIEEESFDRNGNNGW